MATLQMDGQSNNNILLVYTNNMDNVAHLLTCYIYFRVNAYRELNLVIVCILH